MKIVANRWGNNGNSKRLYFLELQAIADGDCSHEIKRCLLFRRKAMTNLDSVLKSRDNTLLINIHIVKAMVFPVVMYGCEIWTIRKSEYQRTDPFKLWCWRRIQCTWVWASSRRWWRTRKPGVLQSMGSQRVWHDWATAQQQQLYVGRPCWSNVLLNAWPQASATEAEPAETHTHD